MKKKRLIGSFLSGDKKQNIFSLSQEVSERWDVITHLILFNLRLCLPFVFSVFQSDIKGLCGKIWPGVHDLESDKHTHR